MSKAYENQDLLRYLLAQPIKYMKDLKCKYDFMSNYSETIFLRQEFDEGKWVIDYSPVIRASTSYTLERSFGDASCVIEAMFLCCCGSSTGRGACIQHNARFKMDCANQMS